MVKSAYNWTKGPVTLCNFLSNLSRNAVVRLVAGELHSVTCCLAIFLLREVLHKVEFSSTFRNGLQQLTTPLHSVTGPLVNLSRNFTRVLTRVHVCTSRFLF